MVQYSKLGAKIWKLVDYFEPAVIRELKPHDFDVLDQEILAWYDSLPEQVKLASLSTTAPALPPASAREDYDLARIRIWTRLRLNQMRIWLHTPVLHSATSTATNGALAQKVVGLARETIAYLAHLDQTTHLYRRIPVFYHQFLTSAVAVLFLASTHAPMQFSGQCRAEFYAALELVRSLSARSWVSQRLWRTVWSLKAYAMRLGMVAEGDGGEGEDGTRRVRDVHDEEAIDPMRGERETGAAMAMAGMARGSSSTNPPTTHHGDRYLPPGEAPTPAPSQPAPGGAASTTEENQAWLYPASQPTLAADDPNNGDNLSAELTKIFGTWMGITHGGGGVVAGGRTGSTSTASSVVGGGGGGEGRWMRGWERCAGGGEGGVGGEWNGEAQQGQRQGEGTGEDDGVYRHLRNMF